MFIDLARRGLLIAYHWKILVLKELLMHIISCIINC